MDPLVLLEKAFFVGKWIYDQLNMMPENKSEAQALAGRILRLSGVANFLKSEVKQKSGSPSSQLSPEVQDCLTHVEAFFAELEAMLRAHNGAAYSGGTGGFFGKVKAAVAKAKEFFGAENWKEQLDAANSKVTEVLGDLETSIAAQGLVLNIGTAAVMQGLMSEVKKEHVDILELKSMMKKLLRDRGSSPPAAAFRDIPCYKASDIKIIRPIGEGGNSNVFLARYPHGVKEVVYKKRAYAYFPLVIAVIFPSCLNLTPSCSESPRCRTHRPSCL
jgi:hypothetical protein